MKRKIIISVTLLAYLLLTNAQEISIQETLEPSPQIHTDYTVTFRLNAPGANQVWVTGDFLPTTQVDTTYGKMDVPGYASLKRSDEGLWEYTTPDPLPSELYNYTFVVDSLTVVDPQNAFASRNVDRLESLFLIKGGRGDLYSVTDVPHGTIASCWYDSSTLGMKRRLTIYTPAGYEESCNRRYPTLYLLHGMGGDEEAWITIGRAAQILDNLIARGEAEPMIVVMPNGNVAQSAAPGASSEGFVRPVMTLPKTMEGSMETSFPDIVRFVDSRYRTIAEKSGRAIAGLSMGGFHSLYISREYPDKFDYVGLFSAVTRPIDKADSDVYRDEEKKMDIQFACPPKLYWIGIGKTDFLYSLNTSYRKQLDAKGYKYIYRETEGGHTWRNWRIYLTEFLPLLFKSIDNYQYYAP